MCKLAILFCRVIHCIIVSQITANSLGILDWGTVKNVRAHPNPEIQRENKEPYDELTWKFQDDSLLSESTKSRRCDQCANVCKNRKGKKERAYTCLCAVIQPLWKDHKKLINIGRLWEGNWWLGQESQEDFSLITFSIFEVYNIIIYPKAKFLNYHS